MIDINTHVHPTFLFLFFFAKAMQAINPSYTRRVHKDQREGPLSHLLIMSLTYPRPFLPTFRSAYHIIWIARVLANGTPLKIRRTLS